MNNLQLEHALKGVDLNIYFSILEEVIHADKILHNEQMAFLKDQAKLLKYDLEGLEGNLKTHKDINWDITSNITKNIIIRDCIIMAYSDGEYHDEEARVIREIGYEMGMDETKINDIEIWLKDYWAVLERAELILFQ